MIQNKAIPSEIKLVIKFIKKFTFFTFVSDISLLLLSFCLNLEDVNVWLIFSLSTIFALIAASLTVIVWPTLKKERYQSII